MMMRRTLSTALVLGMLLLGPPALVDAAEESASSLRASSKLHNLRTSLQQGAAAGLTEPLPEAGRSGGHHKTVQESQQGASVTLQQDGSLAVGPLGAAGAVAEAVYVDGALAASNMGHLEVVTWPVAGDEQQMRAAGFVEAWLTAEHMAQHLANMWAYYNLSAQPDALAWLGQQHGWLRQQIHTHTQGGSSGGQAAAGEQEGDAAGANYWTALRLLMAQFDGMLEGYRARRAHLLSAAGTKHATRKSSSSSKEEVEVEEEGGNALPELSQEQLYALCSLGDLGDLAAALQRQHQQQQAGTQEQAQQQQEGTEEQAQQQQQHHQGKQQQRERRRRNPALGLSPMERREWDALSPEELQVELATSDRCSALVKVSPDFQDLWVGQVAWFTYSAMLRVFKHYDFALSHPGMLSRSIAFSGYYGQLSSDDDFYLVGDTQVVVLQTTNRIFDEQLLDLIQPRSVLSWQRVRAACSVAPDGPAWAEVVRTYNSGTYTNSWLVLAAGLFERGKPLTPWLLTVVEQVPGNVWHADVTRSLESGYVALYNVPVIAETYNALGYPAFVQRMSSKGPAYAEAVSGALWQVAPRAQIFRRDQGTVQTLEGMMRLMRSNNWQSDPFSLNSSTNAICGRGDVHPTSPRLAGCYDGKVSNLDMLLAMEAQVVNGPPYSAQMPPFVWEGRWAEQPLLHHGQPQRFAFEWERVAPTHARTSRRAERGAVAAAAA